MKVRYTCPACKVSHDLNLDESIWDKQTSFPFPYFDLHGELRDVLSVLYIDADGKVRGVEARQLQMDNIFSQDFASAITQKLADEIAHLEEENKQLREEIAKLKGE